MMFRTRMAFAGLVLAVSAGPVLAFSGGGHGGDREPAGGAFNSSYTAPGTTGVQDYGPPRSVDIPRGQYYNQGGRWVPYDHEPRYRYGR